MSSEITNVALTNFPVKSQTPVTSVENRPLGMGFGDMVAEFVRDVNDSQCQAGTAIQDLVAGKTGHLHKTVIAMSQAEMSFRYLMEVRTRLIQAYQEIQRLQM